MEDKHLKKLMYCFVFLTGAVIMAVELTASRLLSPYFGSSLFVWGNIIGVVMMALSIGYYLGGKMADLRPEKNLLMYLVLFAGVLLTFVPHLAKPISLNILSGRTDFHIYLIFGSFLAMFILFSLPLLLLGMVSPFIIKLLTKDIKETGRVAGSVYAFSTIGSILGTFLASFVIIPFVGSRETILISAFILILISCLGIKKKPILYLLLILPILIYFLTKTTPLSREENLIYETESPYNLIQVVKSDNQFHLKFNEGFGIQSIYIPGSPLVAAYYDYFSILPYFFPQKDKKVLLIGGGGGTIPNLFINLLSNEFDFSIDCVEIDPDVIATAKKYFNFPEEKVNTIISDGRSFLYQSEKTYDIIIVDAFAQTLYIPFHLTTLEFFEQVKTHLNNTGILAMNVIGTNEETPLLKSISQTVKAVINNVYLVPTKYSYNYMVLASQSNLDFQPSWKIQNKSVQSLSEEVQKNSWPLEVDQATEILTDNKAPVEFYTEASLL